jgi:hypothetical protein
MNERAATYSSPGTKCYNGEQKLLVPSVVRVLAQGHARPATPIHLGEKRKSQRSIDSDNRDPKRQQKRVRQTDGLELGPLETDEDAAKNKPQHDDSLWHAGAERQPRSMDSRPEQELLERHAGQLVEGGSAGSVAVTRS